MAVVVDLKLAVATLVAAALVLSPAGGAQPADVTCQDGLAVMKVAKARAAEGREIHLEWIEYIESGEASPEQVRIGGDVAWHRRWVDAYDAILFSLSHSRIPCGV